MDLYPSLKPLAKKERPKLKEARVPGAVRASVYERQKFQEAFKKPKKK